MFFKNKSSEDQHQLFVTRATENIIPQKQVEKIISNVFDDLASMIARTIGPAGGNTLITEPNAAVPIFPSKDGYRVMNNHVYTNPAYESIYRIIRDISGRMNERLGDGTTSGVVIARSFYKGLFNLIKKNREITPFGASKLMNISLGIITKYLKEKGYVKSIKNLTHDEKVEVYKKIALISANNDVSISETVGKAYAASQNDESFVDIQLSVVPEDVIETNLGFEMACGPIIPQMYNMADGRTCSYEDPMFLIVDGPLTNDDLEPIKKYTFFVTQNMHRPIVFIANEYENKVRDFFVECRVGMPSVNSRGQTMLQKLPVLAIHFSTHSEIGLDRIGDLEAVLGAKALQTDNGRLQNPPDINDPEAATKLSLMLGRAESIESKYAFTRIRGGGGDQVERNARIGEIKRKLEEAKEQSQHGILARAHYEFLKKRIGMLEGEMHCIKVGGDTYRTKINRQMIFEDATLAVKACISEGISLGGNVSISHCIFKYKDEIKKEILDFIKENPRENIAIRISDEKLESIIDKFLLIVADSSQAAFKAVFNNASKDKRWIKKVFKDLNGGKEAQTYDLIGNQYERFGKDIEESYSEEPHLDIKNLPNLIVPGNTDAELLRSVFAIVTIFIQSNQLISVITRDPTRDPRA